MLRMLFHMRLFAGAEGAFDRHAAAPHRDLVEALWAAELGSVTAFRRGTDVWWYGETSANRAVPIDSDALLDRLVAGAAWTRWLDSLVDVVLPSQEPGGIARYVEIFHSSGPPLATTSERGLFVLVVHPDRIAEYDTRHADVWPDMLAALANSGFRNYSGFRRDSQVAYYGQFHPDMATAVATIGATEVNRRWATSFTGIITALTDEEGRLFTAREVFHID